MLWLFNQMTNIFTDIVYGIMYLVVNWFTDLLCVTSPEFYNYFQLTPGYGNVNALSAIQQNFIFPAAFSIVILNMVIQLYRSMFVKNPTAEVDEPVPLIFRSIIALFFIVNWNLILYGGVGVTSATGADSLDAYDGTVCIMNVFSQFWKWMDSTKFASVSSALANGVLGFAGVGGIAGTGMYAGLLAGVEASAAAGGFLVLEGFELIVLIISIIICIVLTWYFIKMMFMYCYRFVEFQIIGLFMPLGLSGGGSNSTKQITKSYIRMYITSFISLILSAIFCYFYAMLMAKTVTMENFSPAKNILLLAMTIGIHQVYMKLDGYLKEIGLNSVSNMMPPRFPGMAMMNALRLGEMGQRFLSKGGFSNAGSSGSSSNSSGLKDKIQDVAGDVSKNFGENRNSGKGVAESFFGAVGKGTQSAFKDWKNTKNAQNVQKENAKAADYMKQPGASGEQRENKDFADFNEAVKQRANESATSDLNNIGYSKNGSALNDANNKVEIDGEQYDLGSDGVFRNAKTGEALDNNTGNFYDDDFAVIGNDGSVTNVQHDPDNPSAAFNADTGEQLSKSDLRNLAKQASVNGAQVAQIADSGLTPNDTAMNSSLDSISGDVKYGALHTQDGIKQASFQKNDDGTYTTTIQNGDGTSSKYGSINEASKAIGATSADLYSSSPTTAAKAAHQSDKNVTPISEANLDPGAVGSFNSALDRNAIHSRGKADSVDGVMRTDNGNVRVTYSKNADGAWCATTANGNTYSSPQDAATAVGAKSVDLYGGPTTSVASGSNLNAKVANAAGYCKPLNGVKYQCRAMGGGQYEVFAAQADGSVKAGTGSVVSEQFAKNHAGDCFKNSLTGEYVHVQGTSNDNLNQEAASKYFDGNNIRSKYESYSGLNENGQAF